MPQDVVRKWLNLKQSRETTKDVVQKIKVKIKESSRLHQELQKRVLTSCFELFSLPKSKRLTIKAFLEISLDSLTLRVCTVF